ncbi:DUF4917 family protein [Agrobacterium sp. V1]|uniref:DUF4917 family protein n=1 Tax=Agrobacterium sp. V1 TaxID=3061957 RepID=UPI0026734A45|nr:DUF4917 family protein [Agrobacterium sp. V1]MDO3442333.1 DUF4917 family protein [Agrobacterium sp. V1]
MDSVKSFEDIKKIITRRSIPANLLLGNGFSIGAFPEKFSYQNIFRNADFSGHELIRKVFERLDTHDFEKVISYLSDMQKTQDIFGNSSTDFGKEIEFLKEILIKTISASHPDRPDAIDIDKYKKAGEFLQFFRKTKKEWTGGKIFTLNYDLLLYWIINKVGITKECNDGFTSSPDTDEYLIWSGEYSAHFADIWFLHGALHIFDADTSIKKNAWNRTDVGLIDQTRTALDNDYFPIFVTEGTSAEKKEKILHNPYLYTGFRQFSTEMSQSSDKNNKEKACLVIYGHSLDDSDNHILEAIHKGKVKSVYVSIYGEEKSTKNQDIFDKCKYIRSKSKNDIDFTFFQAETASLWD